MGKSRLVCDQLETFTTEQMHPLDSRDSLHHAQRLCIISNIPSLITFSAFEPSKHKVSSDPLISLLDIVHQFSSWSDIYMNVDKYTIAAYIHAR
jgi:hypothetical protein